MLLATSGGVTHFGTTPTDTPGQVMTVGWGQNANNYELGMGEGQPRSATKPQQISTLDGIDVFELSAISSPFLPIGENSVRSAEFPRDKG